MECDPGSGPSLAGGIASVGPEAGPWVTASPPGCGADNAAGCAARIIFS